MKEMTPIAFAVAIVFVLLCVSTHVFGASVLKVVCDEPSGPRIDYIRRPKKSSAPILEHSEDRSTGVHPVFIIDSEKPKVLTYLWGMTRKYGVPAFPTVEQHATIVTQTEAIISAVEVRNNGVNVFTLLPKLQFGVFYSHAYTREATPWGEWFETTTFTATCKFEHR